MSVLFRPNHTTTLPIDVSSLKPETLAGLSTEEIARIGLRLGRDQVEAGELFRIEGNASDGGLVFEGDLRHLQRLGAGMASGSIRVIGDVGPHLGAAMEGGEIVVEGSVGDWAGAELRAGSIDIHGNAGDGLGSAYPGSRSGMKDGAIFVRGDVGQDAGLSMRRGLIAIRGRSGLGLGRAMIAGSILAFGPVGSWPGAGMKRGTIAIFGERPRLLPTFAPSGDCKPPFLTIYLRWLRDRGLPVPEAAFLASFGRYNGDLVEGGRGEILVSKRPEPAIGSIGKDP